MTLLSVNVNKLATLRNSRGKNNPDVVAWSRRILEYGAHGITVHPRPDARHVRFDDVRALRPMIDAWNAERHHAEFNVEGYPAEDFLDLIEETRPDQATLVPDPPGAITSNAGWDLEAAEDELEPVIKRLRGLGVRTSLFVDPATFTQYQESSLSRLKPERVELYTEAFAEACGTADEARVNQLYRTVADLVNALKIELNAGHDLSQNNLASLLTAVPSIREVSIGHALVCEALEGGMKSTIANYLRLIGSRA
jgi:pyridoxine 5-phosphate synthase